MAKTASRGEEVAKTFWKQSADDLKQAKSYLRRDEFFKCGTLCVQSAMNSLTAVCVANSRFQNPTYSLEELNRVCAEEYDERFLEIRNVCQDMDAVHEWTPFPDSRKPGVEIDPTLVGLFPGKVETIRKLCKTILKNKGLV